VLFSGYRGTARYEETPELIKARQILASNPGTETTFQPGQTTRTPAVLPGLERGFIQPLFTPTPTPTPTPSPTPPPPNLQQVIAVWKLRSLNPDSVEIAEGSNILTLQVGGPPIERPDRQGQMVKIQLLSVDLDNMTATFGFQDQKIALKF
ncbi:MAG: hypothetical protein M1457_14305, partial [bacterium]|nr:hypothetical protein [bacterium]